jgi:hypothetical protein
MLIPAKTTEVVNKNIDAGIIDYYIPFRDNANTRIAAKIYKE